MKYIYFTSQAIIYLFVLFIMTGCKKDEGEPIILIQSPVITVTSPSEDQEFSTGDEIIVKLRVAGSKLSQVQIILTAYSGAVVFLSEDAELNGESSYEFTGSCIVSGVISSGDIATLKVIAIDERGNYDIKLVYIVLYP